MRPPVLAALLAVVVAFVIAGCGVGPGEPGNGDVTLLVTRDYGRETLGEVQPTKVEGAETVMRMLERNFKVRTRYGGGFVQSIDGLAGGREDGRPVDWFFYVNGVESDKGAAAVKLASGDRVWWDRRDWGTASRVPAVVGSYPEPFAHGLNGKRWPTRVECVKGDQNGNCQAVADKLSKVGVLPFKAIVGTEGGNTNLRVIVGPWPQISFDRAARLVDEGPKSSGVFAKFTSDGKHLELLDQTGKVRQTLGPGTGLIAATRWEDQPPTWFVTGTDTAGVKQAIEALDEGTLGKHYALAVSQDTGIPLPVDTRRAPAS
jgi:hypothetical protein